MNKIVIGGITDSTEFVMGFSLLNSAKKKNPCFVFEYEDMLESQYWKWLKHLNKKNGWKHNCNFVSWYEYVHGGPKSLIGNLDLFVGFMYEEYNVRMTTSHSKMQKIADELRMEKMKKMIEEANKLADARFRRVTVIYENHPAIGLLCREILNHKTISGPDGIELTLYNLHRLEDTRTGLHDDLVSLPAELNGFRRVKVVKNLKHAVKNCDLLILMGNDLAIHCDLMDALKGEAVFWSRMGQLVDKYTRNPEKLRVVFTCMNYPCFNATFFLRHAPKLCTDLVIAVTHHVALQPLVYISKATRIPLTNMMQQTAHVWGSPGISQLVDLGNTDVIYNIPKMPMSRYDLENNLAGEINWEDGNPFENAEFEDDFTWRKLDFAMGDRGWPEGLKYTWFYVGQEKGRIIQKQQRQPYVTSVRATMDVLSAWYDNFVMKTPLSVGIYVSESIYDVPEGLVFSMPALMRNDVRRGWYPYKWCEKCRETFNMDHRPRWTNEPDPMNDPSPQCRACDSSVCKRHMCAERKVSKRCCRHHRNPDIFLPEDPLLSLTGVIITVFRIFTEVTVHIAYHHRHSIEEKQSGNKKMSANKKCRVSFLRNPTVDLKVDGIGSGKNPFIRITQPELASSVERQSPSYVVRRRRPMRSFQNDRAEKIRKELQEEERKWEKFLEEPAQPEEMMKYLACPVPTELKGIITGAVKMSDLDKQVEKIIKERHKLLAESVNDEGALEEEAEVLATPPSEQGDLEQEEKDFGGPSSVMISKRSMPEWVDSSEIPELTSSTRVHNDQDPNSSEKGKEEIKASSSSRRKVTRDQKENIEEEIRLQKLLDSISTDDIPIYKMMRFVFPESPNIPEDPNDPYWYLKSKDYVRHVTKSLEKTGYDGSLGVVYRKEFDANRLAAVEHYWNHVVPRQYGHVYYTPKELRKAEKNQNLKVDLNSQLLPEKFVDFKSLKINTFVPPSREMGENDILYDLRMATNLRKFKDAALRDFMNRPANSVRMDSGVWATIDEERPNEANQSEPPEATYNSELEFTCSEIYEDYEYSRLHT